MKKIGLAVIVLCALLLAVGYVLKDVVIKQLFKPTSSNLPVGKVMPDSSSSTSQMEVVADNLDIPWEIEFLPDGSLLVTERPGQLLHIANDTHRSIEVAGVEHRGEGGLLGLVLHPEFADNHWVYLYLTTQSDNGLINRVERYTYDQTANTLSDKKTILENIPGAANHDGGRLAFGPDKLLYITTGDAQKERLAQDTNSLAGKILRVTEDGDVPSDNPFNNAVYSYGHRNPQGLAWDVENRLWSTEHGPSGVSTGNDEVNLIIKGANYGWPTIKGDQQRQGMQTPIIQSGTEDTWAPAGMTIINDTIYFVGLRGEAVYSATIEGNSLINVTAHLPQQYGRLRVIKQGPDGWIYLATSNTDGRGSTKPNDDQIIKIKLELIQ